MRKSKKQQSLSYLRGLIGDELCECVGLVYLRWYVPVAPITMPSCIWNSWIGVLFCGRGQDQWDQKAYYKPDARLRVVVRADNGLGGGLRRGDRLRS